MFMYRLCLGCIQGPSTAQRESTDQYLSAYPEGNRFTPLTFISEPLGLPAATGYGWAQLEFGDQIGQGNRYTITRKLGRGMYSSTWLARDDANNEFVVVKVLTGNMTNLAERGLTKEATVLRLMSRQPTSPHCTPLLEDFTIPGKGTAGSHMCFVMPVYGGDVEAMMKARKSPLPLPLVKRIVLHLLRGTAHAHGHGVVHTDIKPDNIFFSTAMTADDIEAWVTKEPSRRHAPEISLDGMMQAAVSQPLPVISEDEAMRATYVLADFGSAELADLHDNHRVSPPALRPPEVYLGAPWAKPVDIWTLGCVIFELVTSQHLFRYDRNAEFDLDETENILYQMMLHTGGEPFRAEQLQISPKAPEYFKEDCELKKSLTLFDWPIKARFDYLEIEISDEDAAATVSLIGRCLQLNPADRPTAVELLSDPWFDGVE